MCKDQIRNTVRGEQGIYVTLVAILIGTLMTFLAVALDTAKVLWQERTIQHAVDSAALAGARLLSQPTVVPGEVITEAQNYAYANGLTNTELVSAGSVELGQWTPPADATQDGQFQQVQPYNAVRVRAQRSVPLHFGPILSMFQMSPSVDSIAFVTTARSADCVIPYGVEGSLIRQHQFGDIITVDMSAGGNWGKVDIGGNMSSAQQFTQGIINGACNAPINIGDQLSPGTGFAGIPAGFEGRMSVNPFVIIPVVSDFPNGNHVVTVEGFIVGEIISQTGHGGQTENASNGGNSGGGSSGSSHGSSGNGAGGNGSGNSNGNGNGNGGSNSATGGGNGANWSGEIRIVAEFGGYGGGGPGNGPYSLSRVLVR